MPLHDVGYRPWQGRRSGSLAAIFVIATTGLTLALQTAKRAIRVGGGCVDHEASHVPGTIAYVEKFA